MNMQRLPNFDLERFRVEIKEVVTVHQEMFRKLLFEGSELPLELAELFEDVANMYLGFSEAISARHLVQRVPPPADLTLAEKLGLEL